MKIYKITSPHSKKCYVGKTIQRLSTRFNQHRSDYNRWLDMKGHWCSSIGLLLLGDCSIELIEQTEDNQRERYWINQLDCINQYRLDPVANREQQRARDGERIVCNLCGTESARGDIRRHQKRQRCKRLSLKRDKGAEVRID